MRNDKYDDKGNKIECAYYGDDGKLKWKFLYDERGNQIEFAEYSDNSKLKEKNLYKYKYDDKGNKIEQTVYKVEEKFGKFEEVPTSQAVWEYEFYPE